MLHICRQLFCDIFFYIKENFEMYWIQSQFVQVHLNYNLIHNWTNQRACLVVSNNQMREKNNFLSHKAFRVNSRGNMAVFMDLNIIYTTDKKRLQSVIETAAHRNYILSCYICKTV
jgi:hypothetical protein